MAICSRVKLLGRKVIRKPARHYLGRLFATMASVFLNLPVYDTKCGAKLIRNRPPLIGVFETPFKSDWIFDVEIIARLLIADRRLASRIVEYPIHEWRDIEGSKLRLKDFARAGVDFGRLLYHYYFALRRDNK